MSSKTEIDSAPAADVSASSVSSGSSSYEDRGEAVSDAGDITEDAAVDADVKEQPKKRQRTAEERKRDRVLANRRSARDSRERRKKLLTDLEQSVKTLTNENQVLTRENENLRRQLEKMIVMNSQATTKGLLAGAANPLLGKSLAASLLLQSNQPSDIAVGMNQPAAPALPPSGTLPVGLNLATLGQQLGALQGKGQATPNPSANTNNILAILAATRSLQAQQQQNKPSL